MNPKYLIFNIIHEFTNDDASVKEESEELVSWYRKLTKEQKEIADTVTIRICGYGIGTLIKMADKTEKGEDFLW